MKNLMEKLSFPLDLESAPGGMITGNGGEYLDDIRSE